jgi:hypothetical protein
VKTQLSLCFLFSPALRTDVFFFLLCDFIDSLSLHLLRILLSYTIKRVWQLFIHSFLFNRASFAAWILMNILLVTVPVYGGYTMILTGGLMLLSNLIYFINVPSRPLLIRFEDTIISFSYGWCFWLVLAAGNIKKNRTKWILQFFLIIK